MARHGLRTCEASGVIRADPRSDTVPHVDPIREAERILRRSRHRGHGGLIIASTAAIVLLLVIATVAIHSPLPKHGSTTPAVLVSASSFCAEGIARAAGLTWATTSAAVDHLRLPLRGKVKVLDAGSATFSAHRLRLQLQPAMPCTAG